MSIGVVDKAMLKGDIIGGSHTNLEKERNKYCFVWHLPEWLLHQKKYDKNRFKC